MDSVFKGHKKWESADSKEAFKNDSKIIGALRTKASNGKMWPENFEDHALTYFYETSTPGVVDIVSFRRMFGCSVMRPHHKIWTGVALKDIEVINGDGKGYSKGCVQIAKPKVDDDKDDDNIDRDGLRLNYTSVLEEGPCCGGARTKTFDAATKAMKKALGESQSRGADKGGE